ncbi:hypothetical protein FOZ63_009021, partial [Perkinsus olseni]
MVQYRIFIDFGFSVVYYAYGRPLLLVHAVARDVLRRFALAQFASSSGANTTGRPPEDPKGVAHISYTCPSDSSDEDYHLGGIVAYGKELGHGIRSRSVEHVLDYLYFWDNGQQRKKNISSMNAIFDLPDVIDHEFPKRSGLTLKLQLDYWGAEGFNEIYHGESFAARYLWREGLLRSNKPDELIRHVSMVEGNLEDSFKSLLGTGELTVCLWGFVYDRICSQIGRGRLYLCPPVKTDVGKEEVSITLGSTDSGKLKFHEIEVIGPRVWREGGIQAKHVNFIRGLEESSKHVVSQTKSVASCEEQLMKYAKEAGKRRGNLNPPNLSKLEAAEREVQLNEAVSIIYNAWVEVRADSEQSRDVNACELIRPGVIIPELTIQGYDRRLRAVAGSEAALLIEDTWLPYSGISAGTSVRRSSTAGARWKAAESSARGFDGCTLAPSRLSYVHEELQGRTIQMQALRGEDSLATVVAEAVDFPFMRAPIVVAVGLMAPAVYGSGTWKKVRSLFKSRKSGRSDLATVNNTPGASEAERAVARRVNRGRSSGTLGTNSGPMSYAFGVNKGATLGPSGSRLSYNPGASRGDTVGDSSSRMYGTLPASRGATLGPGRGATLGPGRGATLGPGRGATLGPGRGATLGPGRGATLGTGRVPMPDNLGPSRSDTLGVTRIQVDHTPGSSKAQAAGASKASRTLDAVEGLQTKGAPLRAGPIAASAAQVTGTAALVYTTPLGSRDKKRDFGGIVVYGKEVARGSSTEHSLDYLYFWDSQQYYNNRSRLNVLFDLPEILTARNCPKDATTTLRTWLEFWGAEGYRQIYTFEKEFAAEYIKNEHLFAGKPRGLVKHIMAMEEEFRSTMYWGFDTSKLAICLWGYVFDLVYKQQRKRELFLCPS